MDGTPPVFGLRKCFSHSLQRAKALVANNELHTIQATATQPLEETDPAGLALLHTLSSTKNLTAAILIDRNRYKNGFIFKLSISAAA